MPSYLSAANLPALAAACDVEIVNTHFVILNSDFILADGSLCTLAYHINQGRSVIRAPSFRSVSQKLEDYLMSRVDKERIQMTMPARELVELALSHIRPTTFARVVDLVHNRLASVKARLLRREVERVCADALDGRKWRMRVRSREEWRERTVAPVGALKAAD